MSESAPTGSLSNRVIGDPEMRHLLVVDDDETIRLALTRFLRSRGYEVESRDSAAGALEALRGRRYALMLCDVRMPGMSGVELLPRARSIDPDLAVVMLTAVNDAPTAAESITAGAMEYLTKPVDLQDLLAAIGRVVHRRDLGVEQRNVERLIRDEVSRRTTELQREKTALLLAAIDSVAHLVSMYESKDPFLSGTSSRVAALARAIAEEMHLPAATVQHVTQAARLHDVGKISLRESVQNKPGALNAEELEHVRDHVRVGVEILAPLTQLGDTLVFVRDHHEHWDGGGYPRGIVGEFISTGGRIMCAADAFIALTSRRAYRPAMPIEDTIDYLAAHSGALLDPAVYHALRTVVEQRRVLGLTAD